MLIEKKIKQLIEDEFEDAKDCVIKWNDFLRKERVEHKHKICLFGAGPNGIDQYIRLTQEGWNVDFFADNNREKWGKIVVDDKKCICPEDIFEQYKDNIFFIITSERGGNAIYKQLREKGYTKIIFIYDYFFTFTTDVQKYNANELWNEIRYLLSKLEDEESKKIVFELIKGFCDFSHGETMHDYSVCCTPDMYFPKDIITFNPYDILVDGGGFVGDTIEDFLSRGYSFDKYYCYELNKINYEKLVENVNNEKVISYNLGIGKKEEEVHYDVIGASSGKNKTGSMKGKIVSLDEHLSGEKVTYIKMDVEGGEIEALEGARNLIIQNHPQLAICLYHRFSDLWTIPKLILKFVPEYKLYLRHHTNVMSDTVLYAME